MCVSRTPAEIKWWMDGEVKRTLKASDVPGKFPYRSSKLVFTVWDGVSSLQSLVLRATKWRVNVVVLFHEQGSGAQGTSDWAGGPTDWSNPAPPNYRIQIGEVYIRCEDENGKWVNQPIGKGETCSTTTVGLTWIAGPVCAEGKLMFSLSCRPTDHDDNDNNDNNLGSPHTIWCPPSRNASSLPRRPLRLPQLQRPEMHHHKFPTILRPHLRPRKLHGTPSPRPHGTRLPRRQPWRIGPENLGLPRRRMRLGLVRRESRL